jgi:hypothetical protein
VAGRARRELFTIQLAGIQLLSLMHPSFLVHGKFDPDLCHLAGEGAVYRFFKHCACLISCVGFGFGLIPCSAFLRIGFSSGGFVVVFESSRGVDVVILPASTGAPAAVHYGLQHQDFHWICGSQLVRPINSVTF